MNNPLIATLYIVGSLASASSSQAGDAGRIAFAGAVVERTCPFAGERPDCPAGHAPAVDVRILDGATARRAIDAALLNYALDRSIGARPIPWKIVDVTFH